MPKLNRRYKMFQGSKWVTCFKKSCTVYGCFLKWGYPQFSSILNHFSRIFLINHPFGGYLHFRKPPYVWVEKIRGPEYFTTRQWSFGFQVHPKISPIGLLNVGFTEPSTSQMGALQDEIRITIDYIIWYYIYIYIHNYIYIYPSNPIYLSISTDIYTLCIYLLFIAIWYMSLHGGLPQRYMMFVALSQGSQSGARSDQANTPPWRRDCWWMKLIQLCLRRNIIHV